MRCSEMTRTASVLTYTQHVSLHTVTTEVVTYPLEKANEALDDLRTGRLSGAAVLVMDPV